MELIVTWLVIAAIVWGVATIFSLSKKHSERPGAAGPVGKLPDSDGSYATEIVGESHYLGNLRAIVGGAHAVDRFECEAVLVPEATNKFDPEAVRIDIQGSQVGYLSRARARKYRKLITKRNLPLAPMSCKALIFGGGKDTPNLGVWLDLISR